MNDQDIKSILTKQAIETAKNESRWQAIECIDGKVYGWFVKFTQAQWFIEIIEDGTFRVIWGNTEFTANTLKAVVEKIWGFFFGPGISSWYGGKIFFPSAADSWFVYNQLRQANQLRCVAENSWADLPGCSTWYPGMGCAWDGMSLDLVCFYCVYSRKAFNTVRGFCPGI